MWSPSSEDACSASEGHLNGHRLDANSLQCLGLDDEDRELGITEIMPPTLALSRTALRAVLDVQDNGNREGVLWRSPRENRRNEDERAIPKQLHLQHRRPKRLNRLWLIP